MAITSVGYAGSVDDTEWPLITRYAGGATYNVAGVSDFAATPGVGDRAVAVAPGVAAGGGVVDTSDSPVTLNLSSVASGSRWDLIGLERDWAAGTTSLVVVPGSASKVIPARATNPGVEDVQPLWLVRVAAGQTTVQEFVDLRVWVSDGGAFAKDDLVRSYMDRVGTRLAIGSARWLRRIGSTGSAEWSSLDGALAMASGTGSVTVPANTGRNVTIALPAGRFSVPPNVMLTMGPVMGFMGDRAISVWSRTASEFVVGVSNTGSVGVTVPFTWLAVQMTAADASG